jgi:DNA-binding NtrC family response regulator
LGEKTSMSGPARIEQILLIDDEPSVVFALKLLLQAIGYKVADFSEPYAALEYLKAGGQCDLCVCDLRMPNLNGLQVLENTKQIRPDLPFVLMSAHATDEESSRAVALGSSGFLSKPFTPDELKSLISRIESRT